jgi:GT2 family glycosyltransferase
VTVHIVKPYSVDKNLGKAYNYAMSLIPDGDWACLMDYDTTFLTSDCGVILHEYAKLLPDAGMLTCFTNRIHPKADQQLIGGISDDFNLLSHIATAKNQRNFLYNYTELKREVSGFLMMVSKDTWNAVKFNESENKCLGIDNEYCWALFDAGKKIYRMDGLYVWHTYRPFGIMDKSHLK